MVASYYNLKSKCISLGPKYHDYFINMWEHCHNSQNEDFVYIDSYKAELEELQLNRETLIAEQELYKHVREGLEEKILEILQNNSPILQTDIYKKLDPIVTNDIQSILYYWSKDGIIQRKKAGKTYEITLN